MSSRARVSLVAGVLAGATVLAGCSSQGSGDATDPSTSASSSDCTNLQQVQRWDLDRRLGQMLMGAVYADAGETAIRAAVNQIAKGNVGGVNVLGESTYSYSNNELAQAVDAGGQVPPFLAVDEEGGRVQRLTDEVGYLPSAREMADTMSPAQVQKTAEKIGRAMKRLSLNMDLAPVVDISNEYPDAVIGDRSFSGNPQTVTEYAGAFADGLREKDVIPVLKHFPGLGRGSGNTDYESATTPPLKQLQKKDLKPYETLLQDSPVAVMTTNAAVPGLTGGKPASLTPATYALLRDDYGFAGVVMTDSLSAAAVSQGQNIGHAVAKALIAGADVALWDQLSQQKAVHRQLRKAVKAGKLTEDQINTSVVRIMDLKGVNLCEGR